MAKATSTTKPAKKKAAAPAAPAAQDQTSQDQAPQGESLLHTGDDHAQDDVAVQQETGADQSPADDAAGAQAQAEADAGAPQADLDQGKVEATDLRASHNAWCAKMIADGWGYGAKHDAANRTHPCLVAYENLPPDWSVAEAAFQAAG